MSFSASDAPAPPPPRRHRWVWWTLGGCGTAVVLAIAVVVVVIVIAHVASRQGNCLPTNFPVAPGLTKVTSLQLGRTCTTAYRTQESPGAVEDYYTTALNQNGWQVTSTGPNIRFRRADRTAEAGTVSLTRSRGRTRVAVVLRNG